MLITLSSTHLASRHSAQDGRGLHVLNSLRNLNLAIMMERCWCSTVGSRASSGQRVLHRLATL
jgi:hypothetical protein